MVHEVIGIKNNIVSLKNVPGVSKELEEIILSAEYDEFYENVLILAKKKENKNLFLINKNEDRMNNNRLFII